MNELVLDASAAIAWLLGENDTLARRVALRAVDSILLEDLFGPGSFWGLVKVAGQYDLAGVVLFGSRARGNFYSESDADIAVLLHGVPGRRVDAALNKDS